MKIECERCHTKLKVDENRLKKTGSKGKCPTCKHIFTVFPPKAKPPVQEPSSEHLAETWTITPEERPIKEDLPSNIGKGLAEEVKEEISQKKEEMEEVSTEDLYDLEGEEEPVKRRRIAKESRMPKMLSIKWKFAFYYGIFMVAAFLIIFYYMNSLFTKYSASELEKRGLTIGKSFITYATTPILGDNMEDLIGLINDLIRLDPDTSYIIAELPKIRCIFHNFNDGLPEVLVQKRLLPPGQKEKYSLISTRETGIHEVSLPILENQGVVRVGISDKRIAQELRENQILILGIMVLTLAAGLVLAFVFAQRLASPLIKLAELADRISLGDLDAEVFRVKSRDEIRMVAESFGRMQTALKIAISRLRRRVT